MTDRIYLPLIGTISVLVPIVVALLLYIPPQGLFVDSFNVRLLPLLNACLNSAVSILLVAGFIFIRRRQIAYHRTCMISAFILSALFLISYVLYHLQTESTPYGGEGAIRYVYFFVLLTHIVLAAGVLPLILLSVYRGLAGHYAQHRRIARWTFPLWLYVSVTGVVVYLMISPYYPA